MPISYTKRGWTNNSPPAINAANLGAMDDGLKLTADKVDTIAEGADVTATALASAIEGGTPTTTLNDTDKIPGVKSDHSRLYYTWANIKTALGSVFAPLTHASRHKHGGADEIATATPAANAIPKADSSGKLDAWVSDASASTKGTVQLATSAELESGTDASKVLTPAVVRPAVIKRTKMPDGATAVYSQDAWATLDSWGTSIVEGTLSVSGGILRYVRGATNNVYVRRILNPTMGGKTILFRFRASKNCSLAFGGYSVTSLLKTLTATTEWQVDSVLCPLALFGGNESYAAFWLTSDSSVGDWFEIDWIWIGDYSYRTGTLSEEAARVVNQLGDTTGVGAKATTTLTSNGTNVSNGDTVTLAGKVYTFKIALTPAEGEVLIGATYTDSLDNLVAAITGGAGNGTLYSCAAAHPLVTASRNGAVVTITALQAGILGNKITVAKSAATLTLANPAGGTTTLSGGVDDWGAKAKAQLGAALGAGASVGASPNRTNSSVIGYFNVVDCASGAQVTLPAGGTWAWMVETYGATYNGAKCGTAAGGAAITGTASANLVMYYERIA